MTSDVEWRDVVAIGRNLARRDRAAVGQRFPGVAPRPPARPRGPAGCRRRAAGQPATALAPGTLLAERYRILGLLGRGGMGEVYRAEDLRLGQNVALKFLPAAVAEDPQRLAQFHHEVRIARQVSHRNVCRVYDIGEDHGRVFLTMELIDGEDLSLLLKRIGRFPEERATEIARQICAGLAAAHELGVLHRDLKPANIMLDADGRVRITDFGLAGLAGSFTDIRSGTPAYMAPEQLAGQDVSERSDIFALGLVLYEIFTGKRAFDATTIAELLRKHDEGVRLAGGTSGAHARSGRRAGHRALPGAGSGAAAGERAGGVGRAARRRSAGRGARRRRDAVAGDGRRRRPRRAGAAAGSACRCWRSRSSASARWSRCGRRRRSTA